MGYTLEQFSDACHRILAEDPGIEGRRKVCATLQDVLKDEGFIAANLGEGTPERKVLYEDPQLGFCILAHSYTGARDSQPHDHGPAWAIYGQARGETMMVEWEVIERPAEDKPGKVRRANSYSLKPGMAHIYNEGDVHSPRRNGPTSLIRIEGKNMEKVRRFPYREV